MKGYARIDVGDVAVVVGELLFLAAAWLIDWRLALMALGLSLLTFGLLRILLKEPEDA